MHARIDKNGKIEIQPNSFEEKYAIENAISEGELASETPYVVMLTPQEQAEQQAEIEVVE